ncbi:hypothetical protein DH2020_024618 [Rehmannia glutinosa]|uniref:CRIB domain-containing protein n=1 Tax=Rehmannia glutinosa TaxID=99300 RepID=A0ABR0W6B8_REHGL
MATKMKGLFKGLRYISQIFEEEKEQEMQIGFPTDVKHVAHIGWDGPAVQESPSWVTGFQSAPLGSPGDHKDEPEIKWVSEDSRRSNNKSSNSDLPELPRSSRRNHSSESNNSNDSPRKKDSSTKSRQSRRNHSKDSSEGSVKSNRQLNESGQTIGSPARGHPDIAKKSRRKKSKESDGGGSGSSRSRSKPGNGGGGASNSTYADPGPDSGSQSGPISGTRDEEKERGVIS